MELLRAGEVLRRLTWVLAMSSFHLRCNPCGAGQLVFYWGSLNSAAHLWRRPMSLPQPGESSSIPVRTFFYYSNLVLTMDCDFYVWQICMWLLFILCTGLLCVLRVVSPCVGISRSVWLLSFGVGCAMHLIGIFKMSHYFYIWFHLMPIVQLLDMST